MQATVRRGFLEAQAEVELERVVSADLGCIMKARQRRKFWYPEDSAGSALEGVGGGGARGKQLRLSQEASSRDSPRPFRE